MISRISLTTCVLSVTAGLMYSSVAHGQTSPPPLSFDVATIRLSKPGLSGGAIKPLPGGTGYTAQNVSVRLMISLIYKVPMRQVTGGPDWLDTDHYDIEAKGERAYSIDELHLMFNNLLVDRLNLKVHKEMKEGPVYLLTLDKSGLKMKPDGTGQELKIPITSSKNNVFVGKRVPMPYLCFWLGMQLQQEHRPVIDKTGLDQSYDFTLEFAPILPPDVSRESLPPGSADLPSIFEALQQQLGLRLEPQKGPIETYVIDHIERPSDN